MDFVATQMLLAGAPAITNIDMVPVLATACDGAICIAFAWCLTVVAQFDVTIVGAICIAFAWCLAVVAQFDVTIVILLLLVAQCVEARHIAPWVQLESHLNGRCD